MGGCSDGAPLQPHRLKSRIAPGHPPHLRKKHGIIGFFYIKVFYNGWGWRMVIGEDGRARF